jgi:hypothetical protein
MKIKNNFINARENGHHTNGYIKETTEPKKKITILRMSADSLIVMSKNWQVLYNNPTLCFSCSSSRTINTHSVPQNWVEYFLIR